MDFPPGWDEIKMTKEVVINRAPGSFALSREASLEVARRAGLELVDENGLLTVKGSQYWTVAMSVSRDHPALVAVVREMGQAASGGDAKLAVVDVEITMKIQEDEDNFGPEQILVWGKP